MSDTYAVFVDGLSALRDLDTLPKKIEVAAIRAINRSSERTVAEARRRVREEVAFRAGYLTGRDSSGQQRLGISSVARAGKLSAQITGRQRPTSLAQFATGRVGKPGVSIMVNPGGTVRSNRMFLIPLRQSISQGLAIRLRPGESIQNKTKAVKTRSGLTLLYGPSVDQVFRTVRNDVSPDALDFLETEFARLLEADLK